MSILLSVELALTGPALCADKNQNPVRAWNVKEPSDVPRDEARELRLRPDTLDIETGGEVVGSIQLTDITGLVYGVQSWRPVRKAKREMHKDNYDPENIKEVIAADPRAAIAIPLIPVMDVTEQIVLTPFQNIKSHRYFVYILWTLRGQEHVDVFPLRQKDALSLLGELQKATQKDLERLDLAEELGPQHGTAIYLNVNESVWIGKTLISPTRYAVVLVERLKNLGVLYFLKDEGPNPQELAARVAVKILPLAAGQPKAPVLARDPDNIYRLRELRPRARDVRLILSPSE